MKRKPGNRDIEPTGGRAPGAQAVSAHGCTGSDGWTEVYEGDRVVEVLCNRCRRSVLVDWKTWDLAARTRLELARTSMREHHALQDPPAATGSARLQPAPEQAALF